MPLDTDKRAEFNQQLFRKWRDSRVSWDNDAREDIDFFLGNHFTSTESEDLQERNQGDTPMDRISPAVEKLKAMLTAKPPVFTAMPREDSDVKVSSVWRTILGYNWDISEGDSQIKQILHDYAVTGLAYAYVYIDAETDFGKGDVKFKYVNPFRVYVPSTSRDRLFDDAEGMILSTILTGEQVVNLYPEVGPQIDPETGELIPGLIEDISAYNDNDFPSAQNKNSMNVYTPSEADSLEWDVQKYQILEYFYKTKVPYYRIVDAMSGQEMIMDEPGFSQFLAENPGSLERGLVDFEEVMQTRIGVVASMGELVLYDTVMNTDIYPIVPFPNIWTGTPYPKSDVSRTKPMQKLLNKLWSLALSHAQSSAGLKLIVPIGFAINGMDQLEKDWANPNAVIEGDTSVGEPHYPQPQPLASEFYRLIAQCEHYIDWIFGLPEMMHGFSEQAPQTVRGTERMISLGSERPKSKLRDIEFSINRLGKVLYNYDKGHYTFEKIFRLAQPNNDLTDVMANVYDDVTMPVIDIQKDRYNLSQHDVRIQSGSTLPTNKWAELGVYMEAFQMGIVDKYEVLKKNPEIFDKEGIMKRTDEITQMRQHIQQLEGQLKNLQGDLQTAQRESVQDRKRVAVEKFKTQLSGIASDAKADEKISRNQLQNTVKLESERLANIVEEERKAGQVQENETL
jgi:hypothetical protein